MRINYRKLVHYLNADGFKIALFHGEETGLLNALTGRECFDAIVYGHAHVTVTRKNGRMLVVSPGEVCGYLTGKSTIAVMDTVKREERIIEL